MRETYHADIYHVAEAVENVKERAEITAENQIDIYIWDTDIVMQGISRGEMDERNIPRDYDNLICHVEIDTASMIKLKFHENSVENEFSLNPVGPHALYPVQATQPGELGELLNRVASQLNYRFSIRKWDFGKVNGGSIAHGGYVTDYEWEFEAFITYS